MNSRFLQKKNDNEQDTKTLKHDEPLPHSKKTENSSIWSLLSSLITIPKSESSIGKSNKDSLPNERPTDNDTASMKSTVTSQPPVPSKAATVDPEEHNLLKGAAPLTMPDKENDQRSRPSQPALQGTSSRSSSTSGNPAETATSMTLEELTRFGEEIIQSLHDENNMIKERIDTLNHFIDLVTSFTESVCKEKTSETLLRKLEELIKMCAKIGPNTFPQARQRSSLVESAVRTK
ncbi:hypothetical protein BIW11_08504 [Tropilaelaps mercedesae]|uniref:Uncharacterized protein n=1 Tax=Tropilaelaps mercedesae TaxID=418985 RepID=A0A1V9XP93_9ACAR|nr:hypothetical protein BIW11_08504 [Tropilaelaps mercedesae]